MKWKCKDGCILEVKDMTDEHLLNAIRFVRRKADVLLQKEILAGYSFLATLQGEMAQFCTEQDLMNLEREDSQDWLENKEEFKALLKELKKRKLKEKLL